MKTLEQYMALPYPLEIIPDSDEGGFVGSYPDLPGCLTCGETMEDVVRNAEDAKRAWLTAALEEGLVIHEPNLPPYPASGYILPYFFMASIKSSRSPPFITASATAQVITVSSVKKQSSRNKGKSFVFVLCHS